MTLHRALYEELATKCSSFCLDNEPEIEKVCLVILKLLRDRPELIEELQVEARKGW